MCVCVFSHQAEVWLAAYKGKCNSFFSVRIESLCSVESLIIVEMWVRIVYTFLFKIWILDRQETTLLSVVLLKVWMWLN